MPDSDNNLSHVRKNFTNHVNEPVLQIPLLKIPNGWPFDRVLDLHTIPRISSSVSTSEPTFKRCASEKRNPDHNMNKKTPSMITSYTVLCEYKIRFSQWKSIHNGSGGASLLSVVNLTFKKLSAKGEKTISKHETPAIFLNQRRAFNVKLPDMASVEEDLECDITAKQSTNCGTDKFCIDIPNLFNVIKNCCIACKYLNTVEAANALSNLSRWASANCDCDNAWNTSESCPNSLSNASNLPVINGLSLGCLKRTIWVSWDLDPPRRCLVFTLPVPCCSSIGWRMTGSGGKSADVEAAINSLCKILGGFDCTWKLWGWYPVRTGRSFTPRCGANPKLDMVMYDACQISVFHAILHPVRSMCTMYAKTALLWVPHLKNSIAAKLTEPEVVQEIWDDAECWMLGGGNTAEAFETGGVKDIPDAISHS